jgi:dTMP kinase
MPARFITFEGGEGTGKSTQIRLLCDRLRAQGIPFVATREPGGTPEAEALRGLLVTGDTGRWSATAEALINYAARDSHLAQVIRPALAAGSHVICDRFMDSTRAYQGHAGGCDLAFIDVLERQVVGATRPDLTLIFDLDPEQGLARAKARGGEDRYERKGLAFHARLRDGFLSIARAEPQRCRIIDSGGSVAQTTAAVIAALAGVFGDG